MPATIDLITEALPDRVGRKHNFSAGPGTLPEAVLREVRDELPAYADVGASIMEISHRSAAYDRVEESARARIKDLLGLDDDWHVLFLQGGASMQFHQVPLNFLKEGGSADYLDTGRWSAKAIEEAERVGAPREAGPHVAASSAEANYTYIPRPAAWELNPNAAYLHFTSNNTIFGTQFSETPKADVPLVCDASSDFLSRPIDTEQYGLIYAGAQKNIGPAGVTVVLVRDDFLQRRIQPLPTMLDYGTHAAKRFNTPPVFAIYLVEKVLRWLEEQGGVAGIQQVNERKAAQLYGRIDQTDFYRGTAREDSRSLMNVTFRLPSEDLEARFIQDAKEEGLVNLKGHRSVGGIRASIYNACPPEAVDALVSFMDAFEARHS